MEKVKRKRKELKALLKIRDQQLEELRSKIKQQDNAIRFYAEGMVKAMVENKQLLFERRNENGEEVRSES